MTTYYIDPTWSGTESGTEAEPYSSWANASISSNNTYFQKRGTTAYETVTINNLDSIVLGAYGTGPKPIIDGEHTRNYCISGYNPAEGTGVTVQDLELTRALYNGFQVYFTSSDGSNERFITISNCNIHNTGDGSSTGAYYGTGLLVRNDGFPELSVGFGGAWVNVTIDNCVLHTNDKHGLDLRGKTRGEITDCLSYNNAEFNGGHGFSTHPVPGEITSDSWTNALGDIWYLDISSTGYQLNDIQHVGVSSYGSFSSGRALVEGSGILTITENEWKTNGDLLYVNLGSGISPNNRTVSITRTEMGPILFKDCEAYGTYRIGSAEGFGFSADGTSINVKFQSCFSHHNQSSGFKNLQAKNIKIISSISANNETNGFQEGQQCLNNEIINCVAYNNTLSGIDAVNCRNYTVHNCISENNGTYGYSGASYLDITQTNNYAYGNGVSNSDAEFGSVTAANSGLDSSYRIGYNSPCYRAGKSNGLRVLDFDSKKFNNPPSAGAYEVILRNPNPITTDREIITIDRQVR